MVGASRAVAPRKAPCDQIELVPYQTGRPEVAHALEPLDAIHSEIDGDCRQLPRRIHNRPGMSSFANEFRRMACLQRADSRPGR